jgi:hypothetical protein
MKFIAPAIVLSVVALSAQSALADKFNFRIYNSTGERLTNLYVSESSRTTWDNNVLPRSLASGYNTGIRFGNPSPNTCLYDFRAIFANGNVVEDFGVNVCETSGLEYH